MSASFSRWPPDSFQPMRQAPPRRAIGSRAAMMIKHAYMRRAFARFEDYHLAGAQDTVVASMPDQLAVPPSA
jgi:hypothetical protein